MPVEHMMEAPGEGNASTNPLILINRLGHLDTANTSLEFTNVVRFSDADQEKSRLVSMAASSSSSRICEAPRPISTATAVRTAVVRCCLSIQALTVFLIMVAVVLSGYAIVRIYFAGRKDALVSIEVVQGAMRREGLFFLTQYFNDFSSFYNVVALFRPVNDAVESLQLPRQQVAMYNSVTYSTWLDAGMTAPSYEVVMRNADSFLAVNQESNHEYRETSHNTRRMLSYSHPNVINGSLNVPLSISDLDYWKSPQPDVKTWINRTTERFYIGALSETPTNKFHWTNPSPDPMFPLPMVTLSSRIYSGNAPSRGLSGVVGYVAAVHFSLLPLGPHIRNALPSGCEVIVVDRTTGVVYSSTVNGFQKGGELLTYDSEEVNPLIRQAVQYVIRGNKLSSFKPPNGWTEEMHNWLIAASEYSQGDCALLYFALIPRPRVPSRDFFLIVGTIFGLFVIVVLVLAALFLWSTLRICRINQKLLNMKLEDRISGPPRLGSSHITEVDLALRSATKMMETICAFSRYVPSTVAQRIIDHQEFSRLSLGAKKIACMFVDIADFTSMTESMHPNKLASLLGNCFTTLSDIVLEESGTIDKYIGDCIMAIWNAPEEVYDFEYKCLCAAYRIVRWVTEGKAQEGEQRQGETTGLFITNTVLQANSMLLPESTSTSSEDAKVDVRIGVESGGAIVGTFGSPKRFNYTAVGDTVNVASRLEGVNKRYATRCLVGGHIRNSVGPRALARFMESVLVKGKRVAKAVYELQGIRELMDEDEIDEVEASNKKWDEARDLYDKMEFVKCKELLKTMKPGTDTSVRWLLTIADDCIINTPTKEEFDKLVALKEK